MSQWYAVLVKALADEGGYVRQAYPTPDQGQLTYPYVLTSGQLATDVGAYGRGLYGYAAYGDSQR